jgi:hypothetical protein
MNDTPTVQTRGDAVIINIPMKFKRRGGRREIVATGSVPDANPNQAVERAPLVRALANAFHWQELIETGKVESMTALAKRLKIDLAHVTRTLGLARLAPDIVEAIVAGTEPDGLSIVQLFKGFPMAWPDQRRALGFESGEGEEAAATG